MRSLRCEQNSASDEKNSSTSVPWRHFVMSVRDSVANSSQGYGVALPCLKQMLLFGCMMLAVVVIVDNDDCDDDNNFVYVFPLKQKIEN